jgi:hypothetical protein
MPTVKRPCPGCRTTLIASPATRCPACRRAGEVQRRAVTGDLYNSRRWRRFRAWFLARHPLCSRCPTPTPATDVDHRERLTAATLYTALVEAACQPLCHSCHSMKTAGETWGRGERSSEPFCTPLGSEASTDLGPHCPPERGQPC